MAQLQQCPVYIKRSVIVECQGQKPWIVDSTECIDGTECVPLKIKDGFGQFVAGGWKKYRDITSMPFMAEVQRLRHAATMSACGIVEATGLFDDADVTASAKKRARKDAKVKESLGTMPLLVSIELPVVTLQDGSVIGPIQAKVKSSLNLGHAVVVELSPDVLFYLKTAMLHSIDQDGAHSALGNTQGVRWRHDRNAWLVRRGNKYKHFKPSDPLSGVDREEAKERAQQWMAGSDDEPMADDMAPLKADADNDDEPMADDMEPLKADADNDDEPMADNMAPLQADADNDEVPVADNLAPLQADADNGEPPVADDIALLQAVCCSDEVRVVDSIAPLQAVAGNDGNDGNSRCKRSVLNMLQGRACMGR